MLPLGYVGKGFGGERYTGFTKDEQITMMTLWCIFRSPLMLGAELTKLDDWTLSLLTNEKVLGLLTESAGARQIIRNKEQAVWLSKDIAEEAWYLAFFNLSDVEKSIKVTKEDLPQFVLQGIKLEDLWSQELIENAGASFESKVAPHGAKLYKVYKNA
jgi:hypothetical protein